MKNPKFYTTIRRPHSDKVTYIILAANKKNSLKEYNKETILSYQINAIKNIHGNAEIIVVTGVENNKIVKQKNGFRILENVNFYDSGEFEQIRLGIQNAETENIYIVPDDMLDFQKMQQERSTVFLSNGQTGGPGCIYNEYVRNIAFGIPNDISKAFFLHGEELRITKKYLADNQKTKNKLMSYEIINEVINKGGKFAAI